METKRGSRLRGPFVLFLALLFIVLGFSYFNFQIFSELGSYVLQNSVEIPCNSSMIQTSSTSLENETCNQCPPVQEKVVVQEKIVEKIVNVNSGPIFKQWWAEGKPWHQPGMFPLCSMDTCFNFTKCENMDELLVYHYDIPTSPVRYFEGFNSTPWYTSDPHKACLFFVFQDSPYGGPHPDTVEHWNNGLNHVLITFADLWQQRNPPGNTIGNASVLSSALLETTYRVGFDIGIPLPGRKHVRHLQTLKPLERKYLLTFRGTRYFSGFLMKNDEGIFRSDSSFRNMHNGKDVIVVTSCSHGINDLMREAKPELGEGCDEDQKLYDQYEFGDLMNSTFGLTPAGVSGSSYRLIEVLSAGAIPVLIVDNYVKPFENIIQWPRCLLQFPTTEMHRIVPAVKTMSQKEIEERQKYCLWVYDEFLKDDPTLLRSVMRALKARLLGVFPKFYDPSSIFASKSQSRRRLQVLPRTLNSS